MPCQWCGAWSGVQAVRVDGRVKLHLCFRCFGVYRESGEKPPNYRITNVDGWKRLERSLIDRMGGFRE